MKQVTDPNLLSQLNQPVTDQNILSQLNAPEKEEEPWYEDFGEGLGVSGLSTYYGIKDLIVGMDEEDKATLEDWRKDAAESGWGTAGEIVGEIAQLAVPGGAALKGAKAASKIKGLATASKALPFATDVAASAGLGYLKAPEEGQTREEKMIAEGQAAIGGGIVGKVLGKALRGVNITDAAKKVIDRGGFVTPGRASKSGIPKALENVAAYTPFLASSVERARKKSDKSWNKIILNEVAPQGATIKETGQAGLKELKSSFDTAYTNAWKGADNISNTGRVNFVNTAVNAAESLADADTAILKTVMGNFKKLSADPSAKKIKELDNQLRKQIQRAGNDKYQLRDALKDMRVSMREGLPNNTLTKLKETDRQYAKYLVTRKAAVKGAEEYGQFTPKQLLQSAKTVGGEARTAIGEAPLQQLATEGTEMASRDLGTAFLDPMRRLSQFFYSPDMPLGAASQALIGQTRPQKFLSARANELRKLGISGATVGAAIEE